MWDARFLERSNKVSGTVKREKFLDSLNGYELHCVTVHFSIQ